MESRAGNLTGPAKDNRYQEEQRSPELDQEITPIVPQKLRSTLNT